MSNSFGLPGSDSMWKVEGCRPATFVAGFYHGLILPISFIVSLFNPRVGIYETNNQGKWYDLGFVIGAMAEFTVGGSQLSASRG